MSFGYSHKCNRSLIGRLLIGTAFSSLTLAAAQAQTASPPSETPETVTVTGTAIRGLTTPTGSNLITFDQQMIDASGAQTTEQVLTNIPQVNITFGGSGQIPDTTGLTTSGNGLGAAVGPTIHSMGNVKSNSTLVLIDGHRVTPVGYGETVVDPTIIPASALERVEVLPDGASSIYGADAVAGVLNFITRKSFEGWETTAQYDQAAEYHGINFGQLFGTSWTGGNVMVAYNYSSLSHLLYGSRAYAGARQDIIQGANASTSQFPTLAASPPAGSLTTTPPAGEGTTGPFGVAIPYPSRGTNLQNFNCQTATIAANTTGSAFLYPYNGAGISVTQTTPPQGVCDSQSFQSLLPSETRNNGLVYIHQAITNALDVSLELLYGTVVENSVVTRGTLSATAFGPGGAGGPAFGTGQINPFYVGNATTGTSSEFIRYDFDQLLGPGAYNQNANSNAVAILGFNWDMGSDWQTSLNIDAGTSRSSDVINGQVCAACATLALNGTANTNGAANSTITTSAIPDPYGLGTITNATRVLTTANALDVWDPPGPNNKTSQAVLESLVDNQTYDQGRITMLDYYLKSDGPIPWLDLGAGPVHAAFGAEYRVTADEKFEQFDSNLGPASNFSGSVFGTAQQDNYSAFAELLIPLVKESEGVPLVKDFQFDISGRYDHFTGFGSTQNPKVGVAWTIFDGVKAHASYSTAFVAPEVNFLINTPPSITSGGITNGLIIPFNSTLPYSTDTTFAGQGIAGTFAATAASCAAAGSNPVNATGNTVAASSASAVGCKINTATSTGLTIGGQVPTLGPETGLTYTAGVDIDAGQLLHIFDGLSLSATYYNIKMEGIITNVGLLQLYPQLNAFAPPGGWAISSPTIQNLLTGARLKSALPPVVYTIADTQIRNANTAWQQGVDFSVHYNYPTDNLGTFLFGLNGNQITRFVQGVNEATAVSIVDGANAGFENAVELTTTGTLGWRLAPIFAQFMVQFAHPYSVLNSVFPYSLTQTGTSEPVGYEHVGALWNVDLHLSYDLPTNFAGMGPWTTGTNVFLNVNNLLNTPPPYQDVVAGFGEGNPIGQEFEIGIRKDF